MRLVTLLLMACAADCPPGSAEKADGLCHLLPTDTAAGPDPEGDTSAPDDTGAPTPAWAPLPEACGEADLPNAAADPLTRTGELFLQESALVEALDIVLSEDGGTAWIAGQGGLVQVDLTDPALPVLVEITAPREAAERFYRVELADDGALFATHRDLGLWRFVVEADEEEEELEGRRLSSEAGLSGMASVGERLFLGTLGGEVIEVEVDHAGNLDEVQRVSGLGDIWELLALGDRLYVAGGAGGLSVLSIAGGALAPLATVPSEGAVFDLAASEDASVLFAAVGGAGVEPFSLADPDLPQSLGPIGLLRSAWSVSVADDRLWVAAVQDLVAFDITEPAVPVPLGAETGLQWAMHVEARDNRAFVAEWGFLSVVSADPSRPGPELQVGADRLAAGPEGATWTLPVMNLGGAPLSLRGVCVGDPRLTVSSTVTTLQPGAATDLQVTLAPGAALRSGFDLITDDGDDPRFGVEVVAETGGEGVALGQRAPDFSLPDLDGAVHTLSAQAGAPVVLVYFATW
jgi:hypothetical protein